MDVRSLANYPPEAASSVSANPTTPLGLPLEMMRDQFDHLLDDSLIQGCLTRSERSRLVRIYEILAEPFEGHGDKRDQRERLSAG